jgi:hypothetical protein
MTTMTTAAVVLPLAPLAMAWCYWRGRVAEQRRHARAFTDDVEAYTRGQGE